MRSILIIGGNSDIGYATAHEFAKNNYNIHLASRNIINLEIKKKELNSLYNIDCKISFLDIESKDSINSFFMENFESPNIILIATGLLESQQTNKEQIMNVNYLAPSVIIEKSIQTFNAQKKLDTIIGISSVAGDRKGKNVNTYSLSKTAFTSYLNKLRKKNEISKIHIMTVKPGWVKTKFIKDIKLPKIMVVDVNFVGNKIYKAYKDKKKILYVPSYWSIIMFLYNMIPDIFFNYKK